MTNYNVRLLDPRSHAQQFAFINSKAKRICVRAGRRGGKTTGVSIRAVQRFLAGRRVLYAAPTADQLGTFWDRVCEALYEPITAGVFHKNETEHVIELNHSRQRIKAKTAWNADTLRGDYGDDLIFDEWQLTDEDAFEVVGAPMLLDNNGDAVFIYTPPSLRSRSVTKARDPQHAAKRYKKYYKAMLAGNPRYAAFHFSSHQNPFISPDALAELTEDMTAIAIRMEIGAEDIDEAPGALWTRQIIENNRVSKVEVPHLTNIIVGVDPSATSTGDAAGVVTSGVAENGHAYVLSDTTIQGSPKTWASAAVNAYYEHQADGIVAEANNGGEMVALTIATVDPGVPVTLVHASRGKRTRAEPIAAHYEHNRVHHVGAFAALEDEMCLWLPGDDSPNRMDALVWSLTDLMLNGPGEIMTVTINPDDDSGSGFNWSFG